MTTLLLMALKVAALLSAAVLAIVAVDILFGREMYSELGTDRRQQLSAAGLLAVLTFILYLLGTA